MRAFSFMKLKEIKSKHKIYLDLDGVIYNFAKHGNEIVAEILGDDFRIHMELFGKNGASDEIKKKFWGAVREYQSKGGKLWEELELMPDAKDLWNFVKKLNCEVLTATGPPKLKGEEQKKAAIKRDLGSIKVNAVRKGEDKAKFAKPNTILIDDMEYVCEPFTKAGGICIVHKSAKQTIKELKAYL